jgi:hypothetical protein
LLALLALKKLIDEPDSVVSQVGGRKVNWLYVSFAITGGICVLFALMPTLFFDSFVSFAEKRALGQIPQEELAPLLANLTEIRVATFVSDCWRIFDIDAKGDLVPVTDPSALAALNAGAKHALPYCEYGMVSSEFIEDASYLRLNTLTIGYTLPRTLTQKVGISNLRVYFTGGNLLCLTGYNGVDPDVNTRPGGQDGFPVPNYDWNSYPRARTFTFGLNVAF